MDLYPKLMDYALRALGRRMMTEFEVTKKLRVRCKKLTEEHIDEEVVRRVINRLIELRLIDDNQYVSNYIRTKTLLNPSGKRGLQAKLRPKGINHELVSQVWDELEIDKQEVLNRACNTFIRKKGAVDSQKQKQRLVRYLASRGFESSMIYKQLSKYS